MIIDMEMALFLADEITGLTDTPITLTARDGEILSDSDTKNIGKISRDALRAVRQGTSVKLNRDSPPFRQGIALPILFQGEKSGAVLFAGRQKQIESQMGILMFALETLIERYLFVKQGNYKQRLVENWIRNLFDTDFSDWENLQETASELRINIAQGAAVAVLDVHRIRKNTGSGGPLATADPDFIQNYILHNLGKGIVAYFCSYLGRNNYAICISTNAFITGLDFKLREITDALKELDKRLGMINMTCSAGIGMPGNTLRGIRESFLEAKESLEMSKGSGDPETQIMFVRDWGLRFFTNSIPKDTVRKFMKQNPSVCREYKAEMGETLDAFFDENCSLQKAADRLNIHKNTMVYRLKKIREATGLDPQNFDDAVRLRLFEYMRKSFPEYVSMIMKESRENP